MRKPILFTLDSTSGYPQALARELGAVAGCHEEKIFADGEHKLRCLTKVSGAATLVVQSLHNGPDGSVGDKLCRLLFLISALRDAGARSISVVAPYLCYTRQDRRADPADPLTLRHVAQLLEAAGATGIFALDVHNPVAFENAFRVPAYNVAASELFAQHLAKIGLEDDFDEFEVISPDVGGIKRAEAFREALSIVVGQPIPATAIGKRRLDHIADAGDIPSDVSGRTIIIFDDLIATGSTVLRAAKACRKGGARAVLAVATHGLFLPGAQEMLTKGAVDRVIVTDTVPLFRLNPRLVEEKVTVLGGANLIADAIKCRMPECTSLSHSVDSPPLIE